MGWAGPMLRTHRAGKGPGGCGQWGLGPRSRRGSGCPPPWSQRAGDSPRSPAGFLGSSAQGRYPPLLSCSSGLGGPLPPASPDLSCLRDADLVWSPLLLPPQSPCILLVHFGVSPDSLGVRVSPQRPAGTVAVGRS